MTGSQHILLASGRGLVFPFTSWIVQAKGATSGCYLSFRPDGTVTKTITAGTPIGVDGSPAWWASAPIAGIGAGYWIRATVTAGGSMTVGNFGTWEQLSATRSYGHTNFTTTATVTLTLDISQTSGGAVVWTSPNNIITRGP